MFRLFPSIPSWLYYVSITLQVICVIHCLRNKGTRQNWIWLIVFVPLVGCVAYFFAEILPKRNTGDWAAELTSLFISPAARIRRLEENLSFSNTFNNRILLADAYRIAGRTEEAIELYTTSLTGYFAENEYATSCLIAAYFTAGRYAELIQLAKKIYRSPQFPRSQAHVQYARALELTGDNTAAENEFKKMNGRFADFEARHQYALFLRRAGRNEESRQILQDIVREATHLSARERRDYYTWIQKSKEELKRTTYSSSA